VVHHKKRLIYNPGEKNPHRSRTFFLNHDTVSTMSMMDKGREKKNAGNQTLKFVHCEFIESAAGYFCTRTAGVVA